MKNILYILAFCAVGLASCENFFSQTVEIDPPAYSKQLSFHCSVSDKDSMISLTMTRNYGILETIDSIQQYYVKNAKAALYKDGQLWVNLQPLNADSNFVLTAVLPAPLQHGSTYEIRAEHPDFPTAIGRQTMPGDFQVDSAQIRYDAATDPDGERVDEINVFMKDPAGVRNFYELTMYQVGYYVIYNETTNMLDTIGTYRQRVFPNNFPDANIVNGANGGSLLSDQFFDGQSYKFQVQVSVGYSMVEVHLRNITEDYYKWSRSYYAQIDAQENPLSEPVSVFNNLIDGLGNFSVSSEKIFLVQ